MSDSILIILIVCAFGFFSLRGLDAYMEVQDLKDDKQKLEESLKLIDIRLSLLERETFK